MTAQVIPEACLPLQWWWWFRRETPYLPRGLDALHDGHADDDPGSQQGQGHPPVEAAGVVDAAGDVERLPVPEVGGG